MKRKKRVLVIDDEPSMAEWLKTVFEHAGYEVRTALDGTGGEDLFRTWRPDAVVTDMLLPDVDGLDLVQRFKQLSPESEVLVVTGHGSIPKAVDAIKACIGCALCLPACPVDAIVGAPRLMHTVIAAQCIGCELCLAPCPVDCIAMVEPADRQPGRAA